LELAGFSPFSVNDTAITLVDAAVFLSVMNLVIWGKVISLVAPSVMFDEVTKGVAEI